MAGVVDRKAHDLPRKVARMVIANVASV